MLARVGAASWKVCGIRSMAKNENYAVFVRAMAMLSAVLCGRGASEVCEAPTATDYAVMDKLIAAQLDAAYDNKFPALVNGMFGALVRQTRRVRLDVGCIERVFEKLKIYFLAQVADSAPGDVAMASFRFVCVSLFKWCAELARKMPKEMKMEQIQGIQGT